MDHMEQLHRARSEFERRVSEVRSEHMALPTPCSEWTVRQLLAHVIGGDYAYIELLHGGSAEQAFFLPTNYEVGNYPLEQFQRSAAELIAAFSESGALDRTVQHPIGELPAMRLLGMRVSEWTIHGWDLARPLDLDDSLDAELIESIYARMAPRVKTLAATGYFLPPAGLSDTAPVQDRLLDLLGRHPSSPPASYSERA
ncbi:MAG TPA: TIGR03086 family metal-binding protein [Pseudonocardiaceae bacterium]|nr:TIGR03086 family metal-binding protein [Pseudonocardiaceae bacterium]